MELSVDTDGTTRAIYSDGGAPLMRELGQVETRRASHVEPAEDGWTADLGPCGGPVLGPFESRTEALGAEIDWILAHGIPGVRS